MIFGREEIALFAIEGCKRDGIPEQGGDLEEVSPPATASGAR
jgi:hypothetical protein